MCSHAFTTTAKLPASRPLPTLAAAQACVALPLPGGMRFVQDLQYSEAEAGLPERRPFGLGVGAELAVLRGEGWLQGQGWSGRSRVGCGPTQSTACHTRALGSPHTTQPAASLRNERVKRCYGTCRVMTASGRSMGWVSGSAYFAVLLQYLGCGGSSMNCGKKVEGRGSGCRRVCAFPTCGNIHPPSWRLLL